MKSLKYFLIVTLLVVSPVSALPNWSLPASIRTPLHRFIVQPIKQNQKWFMVGLGATILTSWLLYKLCYKKAYTPTWDDIVQEIKKKRESFNNDTFVHTLFSDRKNIDQKQSMILKALEAVWEKAYELYNYYDSLNQKNKETIETPWVTQIFGQFIQAYNQNTIDDNDKIIIPKFKSNEDPLHTFWDYLQKQEMSKVKNITSMITAWISILDPKNEKDDDIKRINNFFCKKVAEQYKNNFVQKLTTSKLYTLSGTNSLTRFIKKNNELTEFFTALDTTTSIKQLFTIAIPDEEKWSSEFNNYLNSEFELSESSDNNKNDKKDKIEDIEEIEIEEEYIPSENAISGEFNTKALKYSLGESYEIFPDNVEKNKNIGQDNKDILTSLEGIWKIAYNLQQHYLNTSKNNDTVKEAVESVTFLPNVFTVIINCFPQFNKDWSNYHSNCFINAWHFLKQPNNKKAADEFIVLVKLIQQDKSVEFKDLCQALHGIFYKKLADEYRKRFIAGLVPQKFFDETNQKAWGYFVNTVSDHIYSNQLIDWREKIPFAYKEKNKDAFTDFINQNEELKTFFATLNSANTPIEKLLELPLPNSKKWGEKFNAYLVNKENIKEKKQNLSSHAIKHSYDFIYNFMSAIVSKNLKPARDYMRTNFVPKNTKNIVADTRYFYQEHKKDHLTGFINKNPDLKKFFSIINDVKTDQNTLEFLEVPDAGTWAETFNFYISKNNIKGDV